MFLKNSFVFIGLSLCFTFVATAKTNEIPLTLPPLPEPVSNNAVALVETSKGDFVVSMMGLGASKDHHAVHSKVWALNLSEQSWMVKESVPSSLSPSGRLASVAVSLGDKVYVFGGYTVAADHTEVSSPDNFAFDVVNNRYRKIASMPVAVDDAVALVYQDRFIYIISGWHNDGNINLVQIYDSKNNSWQQASPFVGKPVFGHAGGLVNNTMVICDGVQVLPFANKRRSFDMETACYIGKIDTTNHLKIDWRRLAHPTGKGRYRMAASSIGGESIWFVGGSDNAYNINGIGYNKQPSEPVGEVWKYHTESGKWQVETTSNMTMDHRGLIEYQGSVFVLGGMGPKQRVLKEVTYY